MQEPTLSWQRQREEYRSSHIFKRIHQVICIVCGSVVFGLTAYTLVASIIGHSNVVGQVLIGVGVPSPADLFVYAKPVSFLMIAALGLTFSGFELAKPRLARTGSMWMSIFKLSTFLGIALSAYEVFYNFAIWTAEISSNSLLGSLNPDILTNQFPNPSEPWNLVFATKLTTTILAVSIYIFYVLRQAERKREEQESIVRPEITT